MGFYLNSAKPLAIYQDEASAVYFIDKTKMLEELFPLIRQKENKYICITRPRRFGKTVMACMISSFFSNAHDTSDIFDPLFVSKSDDYQNMRNKFPVIHISMNELPKRCSTYEQYISRLEERLLQDLAAAYPQAGICMDDALWDALFCIYEQDRANRFIFVLDEWDYIFHKDFVTERDKKQYLSFLSSLLKNQPYVLMTYMTGILPIAKYSSGSELNMFYEYTMASEAKYGTYFGFTDSEVDTLYERYCTQSHTPAITREELRIWYDGYHAKSGENLYNPRSVVGALTNQNVGNYWTSAGPYDEIFYYAEKNIADVRDDLALMTADIPVSAKIQEYAAVSMNLSTRDEILSAMVIYGFLSYANGYVSIPNRELMGKFTEMLQKESSLGYIYRLAKKSTQMLLATLTGDTKTMTDILEYAHHTETPLLHYNNEAELAAVVNLVYLSARDHYRIEREDKAGIGYVDFIFYPETDKKADCIILELKAGETPAKAIEQIKNRQYALRFQVKLQEQPIYTGRILAVGIAYDKKTKKHDCIIDILRDRLS